MKFHLTFKTPDVTDQLENMNYDDKKIATEFANKFLEYGEYITIEFDTIEKTAKVQP